MILSTNTQNQEKCDFYPIGGGLKMVWKIKNLTISLICIAFIISLFSCSKNSKRDESLQAVFQKPRTELLNIHPGTNCDEIIRFFGKPDKIYEGNYVIFYYVINQKTVYALYFGLSDCVVQLSEISGGTEEKFYTDGVEITIFLDSRIKDGSNGKKIFENPKMEKIEKLELGYKESKVYEELGNPDSFFDLYTNKPGLIYKISENEYYKLYFTYSRKLWNLIKVVDDKEYIIFLDLRIG